MSLLSLTLPAYGLVLRVNQIQKSLISAAIMNITHIDIYRFSIPMVPFAIATGPMNYAQNVFIRIFTDSEYHGVGECSAFPMIVGETQNTCLSMAQDFALLWKDQSKAKS